MSIKIYPEDKGIQGQVIKDGKVLTSVTFDYIHAFDGGESDTIGVALDCDDKSEYKDSWVQMKLTLDEAETLISVIKSAIKEAKGGK